MVLVLFGYGFGFFSCTSFLLYNHALSRFSLWQLLEKSTFIIVFQLNDLMLLSLETTMFSLVIYQY